MSPLTKEYPPGARKAMELKEGNPRAWQEQGILPLSTEWEEKLESLTQIAIGGYNLPQEPVKRVIGGVCIYKSNGEYDQLPLSFLWEILVVAMFAKKFKVEGLILVPIMEESHNYPSYEAHYQTLSSKISRLVDRLSEFLGVHLSATHANHLFEGEISKRELYGLFQPYTDNPKLKLYPMGVSNEDQILKGYESYCLRYRYPAGDVGKENLIVDGVHLSQSVILGIEKQAAYIPTLPILSLEANENCFMVDSKNVPTMYDDVSFENVEEWNSLIEENLGFRFEEIVKFVQSL
ncbi:hypothetical protein [Rossellomorea vietnamensis]|uniref:hypothetical protein n=1 Tax=Rossellomorea vietnamensis TaxID=218284 RepID=UPI00054F7C47|nr:hypothetical protein [Rossellomorea vietnamensis]